MNLIDRDELELDTEWSEYYDGFTSYSQSQINGAVEVQAIPLDKVKNAREEMKDKSCYGCLQIMDKLIESEEVNE